MENHKGKEYYQDLYIEYKNLKKRTALRVHDLKSGEEIKTQHISSDDMIQKLKVQKELLNGLDFLSDNQLIELSGDHSFTRKAQDVFNKRRMSE